MTETRVFLSYAREDHAAVRGVYETLEAAGFHPWMDLKKLTPGEEWDPAARDEIRRADYALAFVSQVSLVKTGFIQTEFRLLLQQQAKTPAGRTYLIPVLLDDCPLPTFRITETTFEELNAYRLWELRTLDPLIDFLSGRTEHSPLGKARGDRRHWNVPNRNEYFTGREHLLDALDALLEQAGTAALTQAITGLGGIGKTQIAIEFCHRHRDDYPAGVFWADASSAPNLETSYANFAKALGWATEQTEDAAAVWLHRAATRSGWLLVLDNADDPEQIDELLPRTADGHVLITTRSQDPGWGGDPLAVDIWPVPEATDFLRTRGRRPDAEIDACRELAEALGGLPLALEQAAAYLAQHRTIKVGRYLEGFRRRRLAFVEEKTSKRRVRDYEETVATTWQISLEKLPPSAVQALQIMVFLDPDSIPIRFFQEQGKLLGPPLDELDLSDEFVIQEAVLEPLMRYSLVHVVGDGSAVSVHRLVQEVIGHELKTEGAYLAVFERAHQALDASFPRSNAPDTWAEGAFWLPHVLYGLNLWNQLSEAPSWDPTKLWEAAGFNSRAAGKASVAVRLRAEALEVRRQVLGEEHPGTLMSMANLAVTLRSLGDAAGARKLHEEALEVRRRVLGEEHPETLRSMANLAVTLRSLGDAAGARKLNEEALEVRRRVLGEEHPDTLMSMVNLAVTLSSLGDAAGARKLDEEVLEVRRRVLGEEHPDTLMSMANLAVTLSSLGDAAGARKLDEEALEVRRRVLGEEHPDTLMSMVNLAVTLSSLGDAAGARKLDEEALEVRRRVLGEEHPDTLISIHNFLFTMRATDGMEVDDELVAELLAGVRKLPEGMEVRKVAERTWGDWFSND